MSGMTYHCLLSLFVDIDTSSPAVALMYWTSDWSPVSRHWQWVKQSLQQCWLPLLRHAVPHVQCSDADCTHLYVTSFSLLSRCLPASGFVIICVLFISCMLFRCFYAVDWATGRTCSLQKSLLQQIPKFTFEGPDPTQTKSRNIAQLTKLKVVVK